MKKDLKPICFMQGDHGAGRVAEIVRNSIFKTFPSHDVPMTVDSRVSTLDECIDEAVKWLLYCGSGVKISTASEDERIERLKLGSANVRMRNKLNVVGFERINPFPGRYKDICGVLRYGSGGIYGEKSCFIENRNGVEVAVITQEMNVSNLKPFAEIAMSLAKDYGLHLVLGTKKTICRAEKIIYDRISTIWKGAGLTEGRTQNTTDWTHHWHHQLTDDLGADLPVLNGERKNAFAIGKFLAVVNNENGDTFADVVDRQDGRRVMSSRVHFLHNGRLLNYEEMPGGTAPLMATGLLEGKTFFNPIGIIFAFCSAYEKVNFEYRPFFETIRNYSMSYLKENRRSKRNTEQMIDYITHNVIFP